MNGYYLESVKAVFVYDPLNKKFFEKSKTIDVFWKD